MWTVLTAAGPWAAFFGLCLLILFYYATDRVISAKRYNRREAEWNQQHDRDMAAVERISAYHEKRAELEGSRADTAQAALVKLVAELPEALKFATSGSG